MKLFRPDQKNPIEKKEYKEIVEQIKNLKWESLEGQELQKLMYLSYVSAREFAEALRIAMRLYPQNENLKAMAQGELQTNNLSFEDYNQVGDHADFLEFFLKKNNMFNHPEVRAYEDAYIRACRDIDDETRAMTIFSREEELSGIFKRILNAPDWSAAGLPAFQYYLKTHISLDSGDGGHAELTKEFPVTDKVKSFYKARLEMYKAIPELFN